MTELRPDRLLEVLGRHGVEFVIVGGFAATIHGSPYVTVDVDITPERSKRNLERLSAALRELGARVRTEGVPVGLPFDHDAGSLARMEMLNLTTEAGDLDISFEPAGTRGFADLARDAADVDVLGVRVRVASLADVIRSKEAADRPKDRLVLPTLRRLLEEAPRYLGRAELLADGSVLLTLSSTQAVRVVPEARCSVVREGAGEWIAPGGTALRFPTDFEGAPSPPLPEGRYRVTWRRVTRSGSEEEIAATRFDLTAEGRFESLGRSG